MTVVDDLFRMLLDRSYLVRVSTDPEVKAVVAGDPALPDIPTLVELLGSHGRMPQVGKKKSELFINTRL
jgi:hypothetical protein